jgi:hypothetical protein
MWAGLQPGAGRAEARLHIGIAITSLLLFRIAGKWYYFDSFRAVHSEAADRPLFLFYE